MSATKNIFAKAMLFILTGYFLAVGLNLNFSVQTNKDSVELSSSQSLWKRVLMKALSISAESENCGENEDCAIKPSFIPDYLLPFETGLSARVSTGKQRDGSIGHPEIIGEPYHFTIPLPPPERL